MRTAIVVGSGAGGATVARELQGAFDVTVLEAGRPFRRLGLERATIERLRDSRVLFDPRLIRAAFPAMQVRRSGDVYLVNGIGVGGTTPMATGNGIRADGAIRALGIDLDPEFEQIGREIHLSTAHQARWHTTTRRLFEACAELGLDPRPIPKMTTGQAACRHCGRCVLGCPYGAKWDSRRYLDQAIARGASLVTGCRVERLAVRGGRVTGVVSRGPLGRREHPADLVVLAAGGLGSPAILQRSGIACEPRLFVDPVLCVAARWPDAWQCHELEMPFVVQRDHYILSPYFDWFSFLVNPTWRHPAKDLVGMMVKLADEPGGSVTGPRIRKTLTDLDRRRLADGVTLATDVLGHFGAAPGDVILGTVNAGHPGGMLPLTRDCAASFHDDRLPDNVYVADASLFPESLGNPPILTIVAIAKRIGRLLVGEVRTARLMRAVVQSQRR
jgi:choline dehydrogenase-like flavoprotein